MKKLSVIFNMKPARLRYSGGGAMLSFIFPFSFFLSTHLCEAQIITTVAGNGMAGYSGDGGQATAAELRGPNAVVIDRSENIYLADQANARIRLINSSGDISTFAGNGFVGYYGDGGAATAAEFNQPTTISFDSAGNFYIADFENNAIRKINTSGIISTFAGNNVAGYNGNGGPATAAELELPTCVIADDTGNLYISDNGNNVIRKVNTSGIITLFAGNNIAGYGGDGGSAQLAELSSPVRICFDRHWNMYVADAVNSRIRKINTAGIITTITGNGVSAYSGDGGPATAAEIKDPYGVCVNDSGEVFIADYRDDRIRKIDTLGTISTIAGNSTGGYYGDGGPATAAEFDMPTGVSLDYYQNLFISDYNNSRLRKITLYIPTGINEILVKNKIEVFPNPSTGKFTIQIESVEFNGENGKTQIQIYNVLGKQVYSESYQPLANSRQLIDLSSQPNGIYLYRVIDESGELIGEGKVIIQK